MDLWVIRPDGTGARRVTDLGGASFAPYFFPNDRRIVFASNHHDTRQPAREFDLFAVDVDGGGLEQLTFIEGFDSFPMFSPDGRWLVFASNRGATKPGETSLYVAEWRD
jgi:TolB protein